MSKFARWALLAVLGLGALAALAGFAVMAFVFSIGTAVVPIKVETTVFDRETGAPVAGCLLAFEKGSARLTRPATIDYGQIRARTDASGRVSHESSHSYVGSMFWPFARERQPELRFYLGEAPRYGTADEVESWLVRLRFVEPWGKTEVEPSVDVQRSRAHEESRSRPGGFDPLPPPRPDEILARARVRFEADSGGREAYRVLLSVFLGKEQAAACRAATFEEAQGSAVDLFNAGRYAEALEAYREVARRSPDSAWAHRGAGQALSHLDRSRESIEAFRTAVELAPEDAEMLYAYANSLIGTRKREAVEQFRKLVVMKPDDPRGWIGLGNALYDVDRFAETVQAFDTAAGLCASCLNDNDRTIYRDSRRLLAAP